MVSPFALSIDGWDSARTREGATEWFQQQTA